MKNKWFNRQLEIIKREKVTKYNIAKTEIIMQHGMIIKEPEIYIEQNFNNKGMIILIKQ